MLSIIVIIKTYDFVKQAGDQRPAWVDIKPILPSTCASFDDDTASITSSIKVSMTREDSHPGYPKENFTQ